MPPVSIFLEKADYAFSWEIERRPVQASGRSPPVLELTREPYQDDLPYGDDNPVDLPF